MNAACSSLFFAVRCNRLHLRLPNSQPSRGDN